MTSGKFGDKGRFGKLTVWLFGLSGLAGAGAILYGAMLEGNREHLTKIPALAAESEPAKLGGGGSRQARSAR